MAEGWGMSGKKDEAVKALEEYLKMVEAVRAAQEKLREHRDELLPQFEAKLRELDEKIQAKKEELAQLEAERADIQRMLSLLAVPSGATVAPEKPKVIRGGVKAAVYEYIKSLPVGATVSRKDIFQAAGTTSGYVSMIIQELVNKGILERTETRGLYRKVKEP